MRIYIKTILLRGPLVLCGAFAIAFALSETQGYGFIKTVRSIFGGEPQFLVIQKMGFILSSVIVQYFVADLILYSIRNSDYLSVRYGSKSTAAAVMRKRLLILVLCLVLLLTAGCSLGVLVSHHNIDRFTVVELCGLLIRGFLLCWILVLLQSILLVKCSPPTSFFILTVLAIFLAMASSLLIPVTILPIRLSVSGLVKQIVAILGIIILETVALKSLMTKEIELCRQSY